MTTTQVREHPILFSGPMVRAILEGRKTQTRRVMKPQPMAHEEIRPCIGGVPGFYVHDTTINGGSDGATCPYGVPGDRLWVREGWRIVGWDGLCGWMRVQYRDGVERVVSGEDIDTDDFERLWHQCDDDCRKAGCAVGEDGQWDWGDQCPTRWRSSIHMYRWGSRIPLRVKAVRVERLQAIRRDDSFAEAVERVNPYDTSPELPPGMAAAWKDYSGAGAWTSDPVHSFRTLWDSINGAKADAAWADNPWVWVVEFEREEGTDAH